MKLPLFSFPDSDQARAAFAQKLRGLVGMGRWVADEVAGLLHDGE
jgi:hypothetical protein